MKYCRILALTFCFAGLAVFGQREIELPKQPEFDGWPLMDHLFMVTEEGTFALNGIRKFYIYNQSGKLLQELGAAQLLPDLTLSSEDDFRIASITYFRDYAAFGLQVNVVMADPIDELGHKPEARILSKYVFVSDSSGFLGYGLVKSSKNILVDFPIRWVMPTNDRIYANVWWKDSDYPDGTMYIQELVMEQLKDGNFLFRPVRDPFYREIMNQKDLRSAFQFAWITRLESDPGRFYFMNQIQRHAAVFDEIPGKTAQLKKSISFELRNEKALPKTSLELKKKVGDNSWTRQQVYHAWSFVVGFDPVDGEDQFWIAYTKPAKDHPVLKDEPGNIRDPFYLVLRRFDLFGAPQGEQLEVFQGYMMGIYQDELFAFRELVDENGENKYFIEVHPLPLP